MSLARIIDGKDISRKVRESLIPRINNLKSKGIIPGLAVVLIGDDPSSLIYVNLKAKAFENMSLFSKTFHMPQNFSQKDTLNLVNDLNRDSRYHGILIQMPLPEHLDSMSVLEAIDPDKDADGLHPTNMGRMVLGIESPLPCTPHGILMLLKYSDIETSGKHVVVLGRSNIVGKPIANLLFQKSIMGNSTVTVCHTHTRNLKEITQNADILITALGQPEFVDSSYVRPGVIVIDVGVNRVEDKICKKGYRLVGDVKFNDLKEIAEAITPVPGGVGPMTISMLIFNTIFLAEKSLNNKIE